MQRHDCVVVDDVSQAAITALRKATQALTIGDKATEAEPKILEQSMPGVADEVAAVLEAMVTLLHHVDLDPRPRSGAGHNLHAVSQHLSAGAQLAGGSVSRRSSTSLRAASCRRRATTPRRRARRSARK